MSFQLTSFGLSTLAFQFISIWVLIENPLNALNRVINRKMGKIQTKCTAFIFVIYIKGTPGPSI